MTNFSPVLIPTLNRHIHFKKCVESLSSCIHAIDTDLYIALDYPLKETHYEGYNLIAQYIPAIKGFKTINIIQRDVNFGAEKNLQEAITVLFKKYDKIIITEDDNIFSNDFLTFVNKGLEVYQNRSDIFSITGYQYPISVPRSFKLDIYLWSGFSAWGVGIWKEKWAKVDWNYPNLKSFLENKQLFTKLNNIAEHYIPELRKILETGHITIDTIICYHQFINGLYSAFPIISRVRNIGNDGSGIHCSNLKNDIYTEQVLYTNGTDYTLPPNIRINNKMFSILSKHFRKNIKSKLKLFLINVLKFTEK